MSRKGSLDGAREARQHVTVCVDERHREKESTCMCERKREKRERERGEERREDKRQRQRQRQTYASYLSRAAFMRAESRGNMSRTSSRMPADTTALSRICSATSCATSGASTRA